MRRIGITRDDGKPDINILTAEDPVEYYLDGINQVQANERIGLSFATILRSFLRQDPEVILVGEIRDQETADIAIKAALTGHLLLSTLHTNDAIQTITRLINMGVPDFMVAAALSLVIAQRLARVNCQYCLVTDTSATPEILHRIGFAPIHLENIKASRGSGCDHCSGSGFSGRRGIYEILPITSQIEAGIISNIGAAGLTETARKEGFRSMQETGRDLIREGIICIAEYQRVLVMS